MTDYNAIPDARLEPQAPVRSVDNIALRDNPIAITEGSAGAPKIQTAALNDLAVTEAKLAASSVSQSKLKSSLESESGNGNSEFSDVGQYGFYPQIKDSVALGYSARIASGVTNTTYKTYINLSGSSGTPEARIRYIEASRDFPVVWIRREKSTGLIMNTHFSPECTGESHPWELMDNSGMNIYAIELKRNPEICEHLYSNFGKADESFLWQINLGLLLEIVKLGKAVKPLKAKQTKGSKWMKENKFNHYDIAIKTDTAPGLYAPGVKVVDFTFDKTKT